MPPNGLPISAFLSPEETQKDISEGAKFTEEWFRHPETIKRLLDIYTLRSHFGETGEGRRTNEALIDMLAPGSFDMSRHTEINLPRKIPPKNLLRFIFSPELYEQPAPILGDEDIEAYYEARGSSELPREHRPFGFMKFKTPTSDVEPSFLPAVSAHEYTHRAQDLFGGLHVGEEQLMYDVRKEDTPYLFTPEEDHARLMMIRKELYERGLIKGPGNIITKDMIKSLKEGESAKVWMKGVFKDLGREYKTEDLIKLLNTLAINEESQLDESYFV